MAPAAHKLQGASFSGYGSRGPLPWGYAFRFVSWALSGLSSSQFERSDSLMQLLVQGTPFIPSGEPHFARAPACSLPAVAALPL
jgi:hypothetical protein